MIKKGNHLEQILITVGLVLILHTLSACSDAISQGNKNEKEINIVQEQDTITEQDNSSNLNTNIKPGTSATMKPDRPIISSVTANPDISSIEPDDIKEATEKEQSNTYAICHEKDNSTYVVIVIRDEEHHYAIQLFDRNTTMLQTLELGGGPGGVEFQDVNMDGYIDIVVNTGGTVNETHDLYIWDTSSENFIKVIYEGFDMLAWFTVHESYIENFIRGSSPDDSVKQKLIWNGNTLTKESEEH